MQTALALGEDSINASAILVMPMMSSKITGFRGNGLDRAKILSMRNSGWTKIPTDEENAKLSDVGSGISHSLELGISTKH